MSKCIICGKEINENQDTFFVTNTIYNDVVCQSCHGHNLMNDFNSNIITNYHNHHNIESTFYHGANDDKLFLGVELEVDKRVNAFSNTNTRSCVQSICEVMPYNFVYFEHDGSLSRGFECITQPATLQYHIALKNRYREMFSVIRQNSFRSHQTSTCGLHVHFNRDFYTPEDEELCVTKLLYLVEKFWDKIVIFSRRETNKIEQYAFRYGLSNYKTAVKNWKSGYSIERYKAVNLSNTHTIEFRIFRGTLKTNTFIATLQFCYNLITYAKSKHTDELTEMQFEDLINTPELIQYWSEAQERVNARMNHAITLS